MIAKTGLSQVADRLRAGDRDGWYEYLGTDRPDDGEHALRLADAGERALSLERMLDWLDGFDLGRVTRRIPASKVVQATLEDVRTVLVAPSLADQVRVRARLAMEQQAMTMAEWTQRGGVSKKTGQEWMRFGGPGVPALLAVLGLDRGVRPDLAERDPDGPVDLRPADGWAEPTRLRQARVMAWSHQRGLVRWVGPSEPHQPSVSVNGCMHESDFGVQLQHARGEWGAVEVPVASAAAWVLGLADGMGQVKGVDVGERQELYGVVCELEVPVGERASSDLSGDVFAPPTDP